MTVKNIGAVCSTGFGDGEYPIYAAYGRGEVVGILASFVHSGASITELLAAYLVQQQEFETRIRPASTIPTVRGSD
jgi:hypothetical protein